MSEDIFGCLLEIERSAAKSVCEAQAQASERIARIKTETEKKYKEASEKAASDYEAEFFTAKAEADKAAQLEYADFDSYLFNLTKNHERFNQLLDAFFLEE